MQTLGLWLFPAGLTDRARRLLRRPDPGRPSRPASLGALTRLLEVDDTREYIRSHRRVAGATRKYLRTAVNALLIPGGRRLTSARRFDPQRPRHPPQSAACLPD